MTQSVRERLRVLLVDDSGDDRAAARRALRSGTLRRYEIEECDGGRAGIERLVESGAPYDCCVVDYNLPDMDAVDFIARVRAAAAQLPHLDLLPIVVLTGSAGDELNRSVLRAGAQDFVGKEWLSAQSLNRAVENAIERQAMARELRAREAELESSERRLRQVIDSMPVEVGMLAPDGRLMEANAAPFRGNPAGRAAAIGTPPWDGPRWNYDPAVRQRLMDAFARAAAGGGVRYDEWIEVAPGERLRYDVSLEPVRDESGTLLFIVASGVDVTQRQRAEDDRGRLLSSERLARGEAERANRLKDEFLATLSHELRTPLNAILGWAQMLRIGKLSPANSLRGLETIERSAKIQAQLIEDLLDMSRILSGKLRLDAVPLSLVEIADAAIATVAPSADAKGVTIRKSFEIEYDDVIGDAARLQQIVWNLLTNAVKFTPAGGTIDVRVTRQGDHAEIAVADSGQGIDAEFVTHVFERFRQADSSSTRQHGGLGLGLAIVKNLVELHGGKIAARSAGPGKGATFVVSLPSPTGAAPKMSTQSRDAEKSPAADALTRGGLSDIDLRNIRILTVDDDADSREVASRVLAECGAIVQTSSSVAEAIEHLRDAFDILITDIGMPGRDGYELIRWVRGREGDGGRAMPTIAMTAFASGEDRRRVLREGFNAHLVKPADPAELCGVVADLVGRDRR